MKSIKKLRSGMIFFDRMKGPEKKTTAEKQPDDHAR